jgi:hypothetical protein
VVLPLRRWELRLEAFLLVSVPAPVPALVRVLARLAAQRPVLGEARHFEGRSQTAAALQ